MALVAGDVADSGDIPEPRAGCATVVFQHEGHDHLMIFGGVGLSEYYNDLHVLDLSTNQWQNWTHYTTGTPPPPQGSMSSGFLANIVLYLFGGRGAEGVSNDVWLFDPKEKHWAELPATSSHQPTPREDATSVLVDDVKFLIYGGSTERGATLRDMWVFDTLNHTWTEIVQSGDIPRCGLSAATSTLLDKQSAVIVGGYDGESYKSDVYILDLASFFWRRVESVPNPENPSIGIPRPRTHCVIHRLNSRQVFIFAGYCGAVALHDGWVFEVNSHNQGMWEPVPLGSAPLTARGAPGYGYSYQTGVLYVVGGCNGHQFLSSVTGFEFPVLPNPSQAQGKSALQHQEHPAAGRIIGQMHLNEAEADGLPPHRFDSPPQAAPSPPHQQQISQIPGVAPGATPPQQQQQQPHWAGQSPSQPTEVVGPPPGPPVPIPQEPTSNNLVQKSKNKNPSLAAKTGVEGGDEDLEELSTALASLKGALAKPLKAPPSSTTSVPRGRSPSQMTTGSGVTTLITTPRSGKSGGRRVLWKRVDADPVVGNDGSVIGFSPPRSMGTSPVSNQQQPVASTNPLQPPNDGAVQAEENPSLTNSSLGGRAELAGPGSSTTSSSRLPSALGNSSTSIHVTQQQPQQQPQFLRVQQSPPSRPSTLQPSLSPMTSPRLKPPVASSADHASTLSEARSDRGGRDRSLSPFSAQARLLSMPEVVRILKENAALRQENDRLQRELTATKSEAEVSKRLADAHRALASKAEVRGRQPNTSRVATVAAPPTTATSPPKNRHRTYERDNTSMSPPNITSSRLFPPPARDSTSQFSVGSPTKSSNIDSPESKFSPDRKSTYSASRDNHHEGRPSNGGGRSSVIVPVKGGLSSRSASAASSLGDGTGRRRSWI